MRWAHGYTPDHPRPPLGPPPFPRRGEILTAPRPVGWIVSPRYDLPLIVLAPTLALLLGGAVWFTGEQASRHGLEWLSHGSDLLTGVVLVALIQGHLVLVFTRSHLNPQVFAAHPWRFLLVPILLLGVQLVSPWACIGMSVLATYWDVYHSSLQTFGFGRIYDARAGNDPRTGRGLDRLFNLVIYIAPILAGANLVEHFLTFEQFDTLGSPLLASLPQRVEAWRPALVRVGISVTLAGMVIYAVGWMRLQSAGYRMPWPKALLLGNTTVVSIAAWGFLEPLYAFFVMNVFHAVQYYALVWATERHRLTDRLRVAGRTWGRALALTLMVGVTLGYGWLFPHLNETIGSDPEILDLGLVALAVLNTVSILHFWYDGFVWSVRREAV